jgi:hypothetical protein
MSLSHQKLPTTTAAAATAAAARVSTLLTEQIMVRRTT